MAHLAPLRSEAASEAALQAPLLQIHGLGKSFTLHVLHGKRVTAFADISFDVPAGSFTGVVGPSGSGKSSLLKCLYRTFLPTAGSASYSRRGGETVDLATAADRTVLELRRAEIGYVSQFLRVVPRVAALDVVAGSRRDQGTELDAARAEAAALLERLRLPRELWDSYPALFSGGEQQRVNIARALITRPRLLLLDEPTSALDQDNVATVVELLRDVWNAGTTMIAVFHDAATVAALCERVAVMREGRLVEVTAPDTEGLKAEQNEAEPVAAQREQGAGRSREV